MSYIDGFVIAVPTANRRKFIEHARHFDSLFIELGAVRVIEGWGDDVPDGKVTDFRRAVQATAEGAASGVQQLRNETVPELQRVLVEARAATASIRRLLQEIEKRPNVLVIGREPPPPGPGE